MPNKNNKDTDVSEDVTEMLFLAEKAAQEYIKKDDKFLADALEIYNDAVADINANNVKQGLATLEILRSVIQQFAHRMADESVTRGFVGLFYPSFRDHQQKIFSQSSTLGSQIFESTADGLSKLENKPVGSVERYRQRSDSLGKYINVSLFGNTNKEQANNNEKSISDKEMTQSAFGQASNTAKALRR